MCASAWVWVFNQKKAANTPYNQCTISHPYKTRKSNTWNRRPCKASNHSSNYFQPDKQWRPSVEAAECSKAFIWRRNGGNNGIIVLDDSCLSHCYLLNSAGTERVRLGSRGTAMLPVSMHVYVCARASLCWHLSGCVSVSALDVCEWVWSVCKEEKSWPTTPCFLNNKRARNQAGQYNSPLHQSIHLYLSIPALLC